MTESQVRKELRQQAEDAGGQRAWARLAGFSAAYVNHVIHGGSKPSEALCAALGIKRATTYEWN